MEHPPSFHAVADGLYVGEHPGRAGELEESLAYLREQGIGAVVTVFEEPLEAAAAAAHGFRTLHLAVSDFDAPAPEQLDVAVEFVRRARTDGLNVLVHCFAGIGRSATVACAVLIADGMDPAAAIAEVRKRRSPFCVESSVQRDAVLAYGRRFGFP